MTDPNRIDPTAAPSHPNASAYMPVAVTTEARQALLPAKWAAIVGLAALVLGGAVPLIPAPFNVPAAIVAFVLAYLSGVAMPQPQWAASKPVVAAGIATGLGAVAPVVAQVGTVLPQGWPQMAANVAAMVLAWLAGLKSPQATKAA